METKILIINDEILGEDLINLATEVAKRIDAPCISFVASDEYLGYPTKRHISQDKCCNMPINSFNLMDLAKINYKKKFVQKGHNYKIVMICKHYKQFTKMPKSVKRSIIIKHLGYEPTKA